jgi:hypothetical protein
MMHRDGAYRIKVALDREEIELILEHLMLIGVS